MPDFSNSHLKKVKLRTWFNPKDYMISDIPQPPEVPEKKKGSVLKSQILALIYIS